MLSPSSTPEIKSTLIDFNHRNRNGAITTSLTSTLSSLTSTLSSSTKRKEMKPLSCRKCEGHGCYALLKGHAPMCPFNDCQCSTCSNVMALRANALIRRFKRRKPDQCNAMLKTIRSRNGNLRLRILPRSSTDSVTDPGDHSQNSSSSSSSEDHAMNDNLSRSSRLSASTELSNNTPSICHNNSLIMDQANILNYDLHLPLLLETLQTSLKQAFPSSNTQLFNNNLLQVYQQLLLQIQKNETTMTNELTKQANNSAFLPYNRFAAPFAH